jgi:DNA-binding winged helix-turn-helix (wHTH) protein/tetratricopeptide (TPR) repeat protein
MTASFEAQAADRLAYMLSRTGRTTALLSFPPFRLDLDSERLWKNDQEVHLRRKPFAILRHLVQNPKRLVTHAEVVEAVWGKIAMSESLLRTHVRDLRQVLGEGVVETVVGRGYRFVAELKHVDLEMPNSKAAKDARHGDGKVIVGRDRELEDLRSALRAARDRRRTTLFVSGEAGVGKTTLVDAFLELANVQSALLVGRGTCVEQYGSGQAYLPMLDAIGSLCRGRMGDRAIDALAKHAPTWLVQMPGLLRSDRLEELQRRAAGATQARSFRELAEALEALSVDSTVAVVIDDLQWTDPSTVELLAMLANRRELSRLLLIGMYRPAELARGHPLTRVVSELVAHRQASSIALDGFSLEMLESYLSRRFPDHRFPSDLAGTLHRSTGGNPLFVTTLVEELEGQGIIRAQNGTWELSTSVRDVAARRPDSIRRLIDTQIDRLTAAEQRIIEAASIAGMSFTAGAVAHALDADPDEVDSACESLATDRRLLHFVGTETWPDGTIQSRYAFEHALFQHAALARSTSATIRVRHRRIAERLELGYTGHDEEIAAELAVHFDEGQVRAKAAHYRVVAGDRVGKRYGLKEAIAHYESARVLAAGLPAGRERDVLDLHASLGLAWCRFQAYGSAEEAIPMFQRVRRLAIQLDDKAALADALVRLEGMYLVRGELREVGEISAELGPVLEHATDPFMPRLARQFEAAAVLLRGQYEEARPLLEALGGFNVEDQEATEVHLLARTMGFFYSWLTGRPDHALSLAHAGERVAQRLGNPYERAAMLSERAMLHAWRREPAEAMEVARRALAMSEEGTFGIWENRAQSVIRWAQVELESTMPSDRADDLLSKPFDVDSVGRTTQVVLYVAMCLRLGRVERAIEVIATTLEAHDRSDERWLDPELHRLRGEALKSRDPDEAERALSAAIEIARKQGSRSLELRAMLSLHALVSGARKKRARQEIARLVPLFTDGHDTPDLVEAKAVLASRA